MSHVCNMDAHLDVAVGEGPGFDQEVAVGQAPSLIHPIYCPLALKAHSALYYKACSAPMSPPGMSCPPHWCPHLA